MAQITSGIGLISGINTTDVINQLMAIDSQPKTLLQSRIDSANTQKQAYTDLSTKLQSLQTIGQALERPTTFTASTANSTDENVLSATASASAAVGSYQFQVARMVSSQQSISNGFANASSLVGAGNITVSLGGGDVKSQTPLAQLNGGAGVQRGSFRITDRSGNSSVIDISDAVTLDDVVKKINTSLNTSVRATINNDHLVLTDLSGQTSSSLSVVDLSGGTSALNLGIAGSVAANSLNGTRIDSIGSATALASLNDGRGVNISSNGPDFSATLADGSTVSVTLAGSQSVGDVIKAINTAGGSKLKATFNTTTNSIDLVDSSGGGGSLSITPLNSSAASDLGINQASSGGTIHGSSILAGLDTVLLSSLKGGSGVPLGTIHIQDRSGTAANIDLTGATTLQDVIDRINQGGPQVTASLNSSGTGLQLQDTSGGGGNLSISDFNSTTAAALGIAGTFDANTPTVNGSNLHFQWVSANTSLASYNGGKGVSTGSFTVTNSKGASATIDLSQGTFNTIGDVISAINSKQIGVTASINANGNGLLLTDTAGGATKLSVANVNGTTATDLNIAGAVPTGTTIDGSFEKTISVAATDTLTNVQSKIQSLGWGLAANLVNDGSGVNGYHLSLTATNTGHAGRVVIDGGTTSIQTRNLIEGQDAAVFMGSGDASSSLLVTSSTSQLTGVIPGVTIQLHGVSTSPVTLNVTRDPTSVVKQMQDFTDGFNGIVDSINTLSAWDSTTNTGGVLLGDATVQTVQSQMYTVFNSFVSSAGPYRTLGDVGMTLGDGAKITFDPDKFQAAFAANPDAVKALFTQATTGLGAIIDQSTTSLVDPVDGTLTRESSTLDTRVQQFQDQITSLDSLLADKKARLEEQFSNMEVVLAGLQSQQSALSSLTGVSTTSTAKAA